MDIEQELIPTRQSLLSRLKDWGDHESWKLFFDRYWKLIYCTALQAGLTPDEAEEAVQETMISVFKTMPRFEYDARKGTFKSWLLRLTSWRITDQIRKRQALMRHLRRPRRASTETKTATIERVPAPAPEGPRFEALWDLEWEKSLLETALERVKTRVDPKLFQIFDLYVSKDWPVERITKALKINRSEVYLAKYRVGLALKRQVKFLRKRPIYCD